MKYGMGGREVGCIRFLKMRRREKVEPSTLDNGRNVTGVSFSFISTLV
jgi:hypothetical protein